MFGLFAKKAKPLDPLLERFRELTQEKRLLAALEQAVPGSLLGLPDDIGFQVREAIDLSFTITSMANIPSGKLINGAMRGNFSVVNERVMRAGEKIRAVAKNNASPVKTITAWADKYSLPELSPFDSTFYRQTGIPMDLASL